MFQGLTQDHLNSTPLSEAWALPLCHVLGGAGMQGRLGRDPPSLLRASRAGQSMAVAPKFLLESWLCAFYM